MIKIFDNFIKSIISPPAFGLDISDFTIKFMKFGKDARGELGIDEFGELDLPEGIVVGGDIKKEKELSLLLRNHLASTPARLKMGSFVTAVLPEEKGFVHSIQVPKMAPEEAKKAARWELEGIVPLPIDEIYYDAGVIQSGDEATDHVDLLVTAFPKAIVDSFVRVLTGASLMPVSLELESQAISRALWSGEKEAMIFVDLGATRSSLMTVVGGSIVFTRSVSLGGSDIDKTISERLGVSKEEARKIKIEHGFTKDYKNGILYESLLPLMSGLADELKKHILFYRDHSAHRHGMPEDISAIVFSGGDANLINLMNYLSITIKKEVRLGNPLLRLFSQKRFQPPFSKNESLKYTTAIGAALRGVGL